MMIFPVLYNSSILAFQVMSLLISTQTLCQSSSGLSTTLTMGCFFQPSKSHYRSILEPVPGVLAWVSRLEIQESAPIDTKSIIRCNLSVPAWIYDSGHRQWMIAEYNPSFS